MRLAHKLLAGSLLVAALAAAAPQPRADAATDTTPPELDAIIPRSTNLPWVDVLGAAEPGAKVQVNGVDVATNDQGVFTVQVPIDQPRTVTVSAVDAAGNQSIAAEWVTQDFTVPRLQVRAHVGITGYADPGTRVGYWGSEDSMNVDSLLGLFWYPSYLKLGQNNIMLQFDPPNAARYYRQYAVLRPLEVHLPTKTNIPALRLPARLLDGWKLSIDGRPVRTDAEGQFTFAADLEYGTNVMKLEFTAPNGARISNTVQVALTELHFDPGAIVDNHWIFPWYGTEEGTLITAEESESFYMPTGGYASWKLPVERGTNDFEIYYLKPNGDAGFMWYQFDYQPEQ